MANGYPGTVEDRKDSGDVAIPHQDLCEKRKHKIEKGTYTEANPSNMRRDY